MTAPLRLAVASLALLVLLPAMPRTAEAQIRRCTGSDGGTIFTDRACTDVDAVERVGGAAGVAGAARAPYRGGCQRRLQDLVFEVTSAIDARDANRLAGVYHWPGTSSRSGYAIVDRLDAIANRPLVDITALRPAVPVVVSGPLPGSPAQPPMPAANGQGTAQAFAPSRDAAVAQGRGTDTIVRPRAQPPPRARAPVALRLDQTLADGTTPSRTTLGLRRHMDCWWISL